MSGVRWLPVASLALLAACGSSGLAPEAPAPAPQWTPPPAPQKVLMVGNSFTFWNGGLWRPLEAALSRSTANGAEDVEVAHCVQGGASLQVHWERQKVHDRIKGGGADVVVLQGDIPEASVESFTEYADLLVELTRDAGARPVLFMTWDYERLSWLSLEEIIAAHREVAALHEVQVVPVGEAFGIAREERPELDLYASDREHPSTAGSYLALVMLAAALGAEEVETLEPPRRWKGIDEADVRYLRDLGLRLCAR